MAKLINIRKYKNKNLNYVYIGRPGFWGNPYSHKEDTLAKYKVDSIEEACLKYEEHFKQLLTQESIMDKLEKLKDKILGCWCIDCDEYKDGDILKCHGQIILKYIQKYFPENPLF